MEVFNLANDKKRQEAIDRWAGQIIEAKRLADQDAERSGAGGSDQSYYDMSNKARAELDKLGYDHNSGYLASGTSYEQAMSGYMQDTWEDRADAQRKNQLSQIETQRGNQLTSINKAYSDALQRSQQAEQTAQQQFEANKNTIHDMAYQDSERTKLEAQNRGIGNSQQLLGLQAGDNARKNANITDARTSRDARINEIKTRLNNIRTQRDLDTANINNQYDQLATQTKAQIQQNLYNNLANFNMQNYNRNLTEQFQREQTQNAQDFQMGMLDDKQQFAMEQMQQQFQNNLKQMKVGQQYDIEKMGIQFQQDLQKMAKQFGYQSSINAANNKARMEQVQAQLEQQAQMENQKYERARERIENSYLDPTSAEYKIRMAQIDEANNQAMMKIYNEAMMGALFTGASEGTFDYIDWTNPQSVIENAGIHLNNNTPGNASMSYSNLRSKGTPDVPDEPRYQNSHNYVPVR